jgi:hypothetical protein
MTETGIARINYGKPEGNPRGKFLAEKSTNPDFIAVWN